MGTAAAGMGMGLAGPRTAECGCQLAIRFAPDERVVARSGAGADEFVELHVLDKGRPGGRRQRNTIFILLGPPTAFLDCARHEVQCIVISTHGWPFSRLRMLLRWRRVYAHAASIQEGSLGAV